MIGLAVDDVVLRFRLTRYFHRSVKLFKLIKTFLSHIFFLFCCFIDMSIGETTIRFCKMPIMYKTSGKRFSP